MSSELAATLARVEAVVGSADAGPVELLDALVALRAAQSGLAAIEPVLVAAARAAGVSWQELAPALGVGSRQAAERRFLRSLPGAARQDDRVRAERDRRAGQRAVNDWATSNSAGLRGLAFEVTSLTDLTAEAAPGVTRLHSALGDPDATELPELLNDMRGHLGAHPDLAGRIDEVGATTARVRRETQQRRDAP